MSSDSSPGSTLAPQHLLASLLLAAADRTTARKWMVGVPTAAEFEEYREKFIDLRKSVTDLDGFLDDDWDDAVKGGELEHTVKEALAASGRLTTAIVSAFDELSGLCNERKKLCEDWDGEREVAKAAWDKSMDKWTNNPSKYPYPGSEPNWPAPPGSWATPSKRY